MAKRLPHGEHVSFSIDPSVISSYKHTQFRDPHGTMGEILEITYFGRNNVEVTEDFDLPHGTGFFSVKLDPIPLAAQIDVMGESYRCPAHDHLLISRFQTDAWYCPLNGSAFTNGQLSAFGHPTF